MIAPPSIGNARRRAFRCVLMAIGIALAVGGCAGVTHRAVPNAAADLRETGIRYYDTSPYLFIHTDNQGGLISEFVYLPDLTKKRAAKPFAFLAKNKAELTWDDDGAALTGAKSEADAGEVPKAVVAAMEEAGKTFVKGLTFAPAEGASDRAPEAYLFKVVKRHGEWGLEGASTGQPKFLAIER